MGEPSRRTTSVAVFIPRLQKRKVLVLPPMMRPMTTMSMMTTLRRAPEPPSRANERNSAAKPEHNCLQFCSCDYTFRHCSCQERSASASPAFGVCSQYCSVEVRCDGGFSLCRRHGNDDFEGKSRWRCGSDDAASSDDFG